MQSANLLKKSGYNKPGTIGMYIGKGGECLFCEYVFACFGGESFVKNVSEFI